MKFHKTKSEDLQFHLKGTEKRNSKKNISYSTIKICNLLLEDHNLIIKNALNVLIPLNLSEKLGKNRRPHQNMLLINVQTEVWNQPNILNKESSANRPKLLLLQLLLHKQLQNHIVNENVQRIAKHQNHP